MRVLIVHNFYGSSQPSGENIVVTLERDLLLARGHAVEVLTRHSDEVRSRGRRGMVQAALVAAWNPLMVRAMRRAAGSFHPDVVHVHNTFPLISPAVFYGLGATVARVMTLHNSRLFCANGLCMRMGQDCTACLDSRSPWPALRHGCYKDSLLATIAPAATVALHRMLGTWERQVDCFIALTDWQRTLLVGAGLPGAKVALKPNFFPGQPSVVPWRDREPYAVFVGRLSSAKGVHTLVEAWGHWGAGAPELRLIGEGELRPLVEAASSRSSVRLLGRLTHQDTLAQVARARLLILPSEGFEAFPLVLREAFALGTPVVISDNPSMACLVSDGTEGAVFTRGDAASLLATVQSVWARPDCLRQYADAGRERYLALYEEGANYERLIALYKDAIQQRLTQGAAQ